MHPIIAQEIAKARIDDWHRHARRAGMARAARLTRNGHDRRFVPAHAAIVLARRVIAALGVRSLRPASAQPERGPEATS